MCVKAKEKKSKKYYIKYATRAVRVMYISRAHSGVLMMLRFDDDIYYYV